MAEIVAAALTSHAPMVTGKPEVSRPDQRDHLYAGFHEVRRRLEAARPDLLVMFVNDHLQNFPYSNLPAFCVGLAPSYDVPSPGGAKLMRIPPRKVRGAVDWNMALLESGLEAGFDFAYSYEIESWDELSVPLHFLDPEGTLPVAPIYTNCGAPPLPTLRRCHAMGAFVGDYVRSRPAGERIALVATGGISHWVGTPETGRINTEWDHRILDHIARADVEPLLSLTWADIERESGNGGQEIRNWVALLGAVPGWKGESLAYALFNLQERGRLFIGPGDEVYEGQIVGESARDGDMVVNPLKGKKLTNIRTTSKDEAVRLTPPLRMTLERALAYIQDDELVEVTPKAIRLRKRHLDPNERKKAERAKEALALA